MSGEESFVASLDVGTTKLKCSLVNKRGVVRHSADANIELIYSNDGHVEIDPIQIWESACSALRRVTEGAGINFLNIDCIGISSHRGTFITWNKTSGIPYHNLITWKDSRANSIVQQLNGSAWFKIFKWFAGLVYLFTRMPSYYAAKNFQFENIHVICKLVWILNNYPVIRSDIEKNDVAFGTLDSWLLFKLGAQQPITDPSQASGTALYSPYDLSWFIPILRALKIPPSILPTVVDSSGSHFGETSSSLFGCSIPIRASVADQSAALFGSFCLNQRSIKLTMGTGAFLNENIGLTPSDYCEGFYTLVAWRCHGITTYTREASAPDFGSAIEWAVDAGLCKDAEDCTIQAASVPDSDGVVFIPAFNGLRVPVKNPELPCGFLGIKKTTTVPHMLKAILESLAYTAASLYECYTKMVDAPLKLLKVDGGVSKNDFVLQKLSNSVGIEIVRYSNVEQSSLGAAYLAGLASGFWQDVAEIIDLVEEEIHFYPNEEQEIDQEAYRQWKEKVTKLAIAFN